MLTENIVSGFIATGIVPYNPNAVPSEAYLPSEIHDVTESGSTSNGASATPTDVTPLSNDLAAMVADEAEPFMALEPAENASSSAVTLCDLEVLLPSTSSVVDLPIELEESFSGGLDTSMLSILAEVAELHEEDQVPKDDENQPASQHLTPLQIIESALSSETLLRYREALSKGTEICEPMFDS